MHENLQTLLKLPLYGYCGTSPYVCVSNARSHTCKACPHPPEKTNNERRKEIERKGRGEGCGQSLHEPALETSTGFLSFLLETIQWNLEPGGQLSKTKSLRSNDKVSASVLLNSAQSPFTSRLSWESLRNWISKTHQQMLFALFWGFVCLLSWHLLPPINNSEVGINTGSSGVCKRSNEFDVLRALAWRTARAHRSGWFYMLWSNMEN